MSLPGMLTRITDPDVTKVRKLCEQLRQEKKNFCLTHLDVFLIARKNNVDPCAATARYDFRRFDSGYPLDSYVVIEYKKYFRDA